MHCSHSRRWPAPMSAILIPRSLRTVTQNRRSCAIAFSPKLALDIPVDPFIAERLEAVVEHLDERGFRIARCDPIWPPDATEEALMPLQHVGLAGLYGADFQKDPAQFDPDVARQIERGFSLRGVEVSAALGASAAIRTAFAAFFCEFDLLLAPTVPCVAWPLV